MSLLKNLFFSIIASVFILSGISFAQTIVWWQFVWSVDSIQRWYFDQWRVTQSYTTSQCIWANVNVRYYLSSDYDNDGLFDYKLDYRLRDNFWTTGGPNSVKVALLTSRIAWSSVGTNVSYYTANPNILSIYANNQSYPIDTTKTWYRQSNIAPKDVFVRAVESEPLLFEIPSSKNPADAKFQVAYSIRFKDYDSVKPSWNSTYVAYQIPNASFAWPVTNSNAWYLNSLTPSFDTFYWPNWPNNYTNGTSFITRSIQWQEPEKTHSLECHNWYLSRCGDGYIDVSNQQPINWSTTQPYPISDSGISESCDPWANLSSYTDDVMPNGAAPTAYYNCTATCTIVNNPQSPILVYTKTVRNITTNSNNGQFVEADSQTAWVVVHTGDTVQYQITINRTGWPVINTVLSDVLPWNNGFILSAYSINGWPQISATSFPTTNITSQLNVWSVVVTLYGIVGSPTSTAFVNTATITDPAYPLGVPTLTPGSNVAWTILDNTPPPTPDVSIKKEVEVSLNSNTRQELSTVNSGQTVRFKITYKNISSVNATPTITDTLPTGLTCVSAQHQNSTAIPCISNGISYYAGILNPGVEQYIIITATVNSALPTGVTTNTANIQIPGGPIKSDPAQVQPQSITDFIVTKRILSGVVMPGTIMKYEIWFKNTSNTPITSYTLTDPLQNSTYVPGSSRLNGTIAITPSYVGNILTRWCNSTNTALNGQTVCPLQPGANGTIVFDVIIN